MSARNTPVQRIARTASIVDDEPRLRQVLMQLMRNDGFTCLEAGNGEEAIALLEQHSRDARAERPAHAEARRHRTAAGDSRALAGHGGRDDHRGSGRRGRGELPRDRRDGLSHQAVPPRRGAGARRAGAGEAAARAREPRLPGEPAGEGRGAGAPARGAVPRERAVARRGARGEGPVHARPLHPREPLLGGDRAGAGPRAASCCAASSSAATCTTSARSACARTC